MAGGTIPINDIRGMVFAQSVVIRVILSILCLSNMRFELILNTFSFLGLEGMAYTKQEKLTRCKLAAVYRLIDMYGWTQGIYNHVTVSPDLKLNKHKLL